MANYKDLNELDLKLHLLSGSQIAIDNILLKPYQLKEIRDYGYTKYINDIQWLSLGIDDFINSISDTQKKDFLIEQKENLKVFDFFIKLGGTDVFERLTQSLGMIFRTDDIKVIGEGIIGIDFEKMGILTKVKNSYVVNQDILESIEEKDIRLVHRDNFDDIIEVVKLQNYLMKAEEKDDEINPANDEVRALMEHMQKMREKVEAKKRAQKSQDGDMDIDISDIISAVSSKSNSINRFNIWDLTLYALYDEYSRLELIDSYETSIRAIMAGAEKINLRHWASKL